MMEKLVIFLFLSLATAEKPWWLKVAEKQGPMVCAEEHVQDGERRFATPWTGGNLCGKETIIRYSCCYGYSRMPGEPGCSLVKSLKNIVETAKGIGAKKFIKHAEQVGLLPLLSNRGAYTVFVARDAAFESLTKDQEKTLNATKRSRSRPPVLLYTIAEGRIEAEDFPDTLTTLYREGSVLIKKFPNRLLAVNCIPLVATNLEATNGLIHVTESLLLPPGRTTITDLLARTPTLSTTGTILVRAQLGNDLRDKKPITVFAPTDEAWESLPQTFMDALMEHPSALKVLLQYHVIEDVWCPAIASGGGEMKTLEGSTVQITCNSSGHYVNGALIVHRGLAAGNGYVHHINSVLIPQRVRSVSEYLQDQSFNYFLKLAEVGGILPLLQRQDIYTLFIPDDEAFENLSNETLTNILSQPNLARSVVAFHIISGRQLTSNIIDGEKLLTLQGSETLLRCKMHKKRLTIEGALVKEANIETRNGILHIIDRVLIPPEKTILEIFSEGNYSLLNQTEPNLLKLLDNSSAVFTVFAPSDEVINVMSPGLSSRLILDHLLLYKIMSLHILPSYVVSNSLEPSLTYSFSTIGNSSITVTKEAGGSLTIGRFVEVVMSDQQAINGVFHDISRLIQT
ncbi:periostin-like isoform X2 [Uloborus diversus]|uniref:periostin-like isoform X2 n=1 Tax=Uloborus diversus TaxID=327109 RepID=UPI0024096CC2|nr:periostin-like isoform X2 [Uloborus diversus]